jgi:hypothetical protein
MRTSRSHDLPPRFVVCIDNSGYEASLELHKIYSVVEDLAAAEDGDLRIVDESGEDYLYAASRFMAIEIPKTLERAILGKAS